MHTVRAAALVDDDRHYRFTPNGLVIDGRLPRFDYERIGRRFGQIITGLRWGVGDWILYGEAEDYYTYDRAQALTGLSYESLSQSRRVAEAFPLALRVEHLSWSHHRAALGLPVAERPSVLARAHAGDWTAAMLLEFVATRRSAALKGLPLAAVRAPAREPHRRISGWRPNRDRRRQLRTCPKCGHSWSVRTTAAT